LVSTNHPIIVLHQSGHLASVNNYKALELLNINKNTPNPTGRIIRRKANSQEPNGVLEEAVISAMATAFSKVPPEIMQNMAKTALNTYIKNGYTTVQEGRRS
jgi:predicted amidohydrolase YtcJ